MRNMNNQIVTQKKRPPPSKKVGKLTLSKKYDTSTASQRQRILQHLKSGKSLTTQQARVDLNIMHPGGRLSELRKAGWNIKMVWVEVDSGKAKHCIGQYFLSSEKAKGGETC